MSELYALHKLTITTGNLPLYVALANQLTGLSRHKARLAISAGLVTVDGAVQLAPQAPSTAGASLVCDLRQGIPNRGQQRAANKLGIVSRAGRPFTILHQDGDVVVVDKAAGVLSAPTDSDSRGHVPELLRRFWRGRGDKVPHLGVVHRIDQATSGCLAIALNASAQRILHNQFATHVASRTYRCLVAGNPRHDVDTLINRLGHGPDGRRCVMEEGRPGKEAITHFTVLARFKRAAELECKLETGRTHQVRIQLANIACPIIGDQVYQRRERNRIGATRMMLHAHTIAFDHPRTGQRITVEAPIPPAFTQMRKALARE